MGIIGIISMIVVGFIVGVLARFLYPGAVSMGFWMTVLIGIGGSLVGGVIGSILFKSPDGRFHPAGWILSIVGSIGLIWLYLTYLR
ncbi:MAG: GlsB/YeaQ/YmgE family stress response membrane protein [Casimicrobiaceae bacterium]